MSKKSTGKRMGFIVFALFLAGMYVLLFRQPTKLTHKYSPLPVVARSSSYTSDALEISFMVPKGFEVKDQGILINLANNIEGNITIGRSGTNYNSIEDYFGFIRERNNFGDVLFSKAPSSKYQILHGKIQQSKLYLVYVDHWVFSLSTTSPDLYDDLEEIVQSFKYLGE